VLCVEYIVVTATVDIVQYYSVLCGVYCGYSNSRYSSNVLCFCGVYCGCSNSRYRVMVLCCFFLVFFEITAKVDLV